MGIWAVAEFVRSPVAYGHAHCAVCLSELFRPILGVDGRTCLSPSPMEP